MSMELEELRLSREGSSWTEKRLQLARGGTGMRGAVRQAGVWGA